MIKHEKPASLSVKIIAPLLLLLLITTHASFAKSTLLKLEPNLSILLPEAYTKHDTLGIQVITTKYKSDQMMVVRTPMSAYGIEINNEHDLEMAYKGMVNGLLNKTEGKIIDQYITEKENLKMINFIAKGKLNGVAYTMECLGIALNRNIYMAVIYKSGDTYSDQELPELLKVTGKISRKDQFTGSEEPAAVDPGEKAYNASYKVGYYIVGPALMIGLVVFIVVWVRRKSRS